jgi:hypothetical protein
MSHYQLGQNRSCSGRAHDFRSVLKTQHLRVDEYKSWQDTHDLLSGLLACAFAAAGVWALGHVVTNSTPDAAVGRTGGEPAAALALRT